MVNFFTSLSCYSGINIFGIVNAFTETAVFSSPDASVEAVNAVTDGNQTLEGVFVVNGKVVIVKDGKQYTAAGARIK